MVKRIGDGRSNAYGTYVRLGGGRWRAFSLVRGRSGPSPVPRWRRLLARLSLLIWPTVSEFLTASSHLHNCQFCGVAFPCYLSPGSFGCQSPRSCREELGVSCLVSRVRSVRRAVRA